MSRESNSAKIAILHDRSHMFALAREFFSKRGVKEVDVPLLSASASVDAHIDLITAIYNQKETRYLHSSPEFGMKRLLAMGIGDIYQLAHVFRDGEYGVKHNPEFTMAEWYRIGITFEEMIQETFDFVKLFIGDHPTISITYKDAIQRYAGFDYTSATNEDLWRYIKKLDHTPYAGMEHEDKDALLNMILAISVEPHLGCEGLCALTHYPATQAALAQTKWHGQEAVAERFEIYYQGVELANGYHELADAHEQRHRFLEANIQRIALGKSPLPIDENFLAALELGLPECCGVAVGFDRLMMLRHQSPSLAAILPFDWIEA